MNSRLRSPLSAETADDSQKIRILIADHHPIVRAGLRALITVELDLALVGEAQDGIEVVRKHQELEPDVTVLDLAMPRQDGLAALSEIRNRNPLARVLMLSAHAEDEHLFSAIEAGALGYWLKDATKPEILQAIREVARGEALFHPALTRRLIKELQQPQVAMPETERLTEREIQVLGLVARGLSNTEIASALVVAERTVRTHTSNIFAKLHLANRTQAARYALREGLARLDG